MAEDKALVLEVIPVGPLQCNCIILGDQKTKDALLVDPGDDAERILELVTAPEETILSTVKV